MVYIKVCWLALIVFSWFAHCESDPKKITVSDLKKLVEQTETRAQAQLDNAQIVIDNLAQEMDLSDMKTVLEDDTKFSSLAASRGEVPLPESESQLWKQLEAASSQMNLQSVRQQSKYPDDMYMFILISLSMPVNDLKTMMYDMTYQYPDKQMVLVLNGALNNDVSALVNYLWKLMPDEMEVPVVIDPNVFKSFDPPGVPYFAVQRAPDDWRQVIGNVNLSQVIQYAENDNYAGEAVGRIYPIAEPSMLDEMIARANEIDWDTMKADAIDKLLAAQKARIDIPRTVTSYSYYVDPTVTIEEDIYVHDNQLLVAAGTRINPLEHMPLTKRYLIFDVSDDTQIPLLRYLVDQYPFSKIISTRLPSSELRAPLHEEFGMIYQVDPMLHERFGLERVPSMVYQDGIMLAVDVLSPDEFNDAQAEANRHVE
jgi:conjugal transfer pilus assembly protein TraW